MTYATQQDLVDRFGTPELAQLTDPVSGTTINATTVARALGDADAEIDGRLAPRYQLPLASTPLVLVRVAADLARYFLWDARATEQVRNRAQEARRLLDQIAAGDVVLGGATVLAAGPAAVAVVASSPTRTFSSDLLDQFAPGG